MQPTKLDKTINNFMNATAKSKVAVIVPLYGFWNDIPNNPVNGEVLKWALPRLYSKLHHLYIIFVAHPESLPTDLNNPNSVANILAGFAKGGHTKYVRVPRNASYMDYLIEGMDYALNETDAPFIMTFNPWTLIQHGAIDVLIDRCNRGDEARVISGYDLRSVITADQFDNYKYTIPRDEYDVVFNLMAMPRFMAEMVKLDPNYQSHPYGQRDIWQQVMQSGFIPIASQRILTFPFNFPWSKYENKETFEADSQYFTKKWGFDPGIKWADPRGAKRQDKSAAGQV